MYRNWKWDEGNLKMCIMQINMKNRVIPTRDNARDLEKWMDDIEPEIVDIVLEFLSNRDLLTEQGERVALKFWELFIEDKE